VPHIVPPIYTNATVAARLVGPTPSQLFRGGVWLPALPDRFYTGPAPASYAQALAAGRAYAASEAAATGGAPDETAAATTTAAAAESAAVTAATPESDDDGDDESSSSSYGGIGGTAPTAAAVLSAPWPPLLSSNWFDFHFRRGQVRAVCVLGCPFPIAVGVLTVGADTLLAARHSEQKLGRYFPPWAAGGGATTDGGCPWGSGSALMILHSTGDSLSGPALPHRLPAKTPMPAAAAAAVAVAAAALATAESSGTDEGASDKGANDKWTQSDLICRALTAAAAAAAAPNAAAAAAAASERACGLLPSQRSVVDIVPLPALSGLQRCAASEVMAAWLPALAATDGDGAGAGAGAGVGGSSADEDEDEDEDDGEAVAAAAAAAADPEATPDTAATAAEADVEGAGDADADTGVDEQTDKWRPSRADLTRRLELALLVAIATAAAAAAAGDEAARPPFADTVFFENFIRPAAAAPAVAALMKLSSARARVLLSAPSTASGTDFGKLAKLLTVAEKAGWLATKKAPGNAGGLTIKALNAAHPAVAAVAKELTAKDRQAMSRALRAPAAAAAAATPAPAPAAHGGADAGAAANAGACGSEKLEAEYLIVEAVKVRESLRAFLLKHAPAVAADAAVAACILGADAAAGAGGVLNARGGLAAPERDAPSLARTLCLDASSVAPLAAVKKAVQQYLTSTSAAGSAASASGGRGEGDDREGDGNHRDSNRRGGGGSGGGDKRMLALDAPMAAALGLKNWDPDTATPLLPQELATLVERACPPVHVRAPTSTALVLLVALGAAAGVSVQGRKIPAAPLAAAMRGLGRAEGVAALTAALIGAGALVWKGGEPPVVTVAVVTVKGHPVTYVGGIEIIGYSLKRLCGSGGLGDRLGCAVQAVEVDAAVQQQMGFARPKSGEVMRLQGDQAARIAQVLAEMGVPPADVKVYRKGKIARA
jgi:translation initiation factor 1 (eIF-1/SUI1)